VIDTAMVLTLRDVAVSLDARLAEAVAGLSALETRFGAVEIMGRTRMQAALPITAGHRIATWRAPLESCRDRLETVSQKVFALQLGGPVGTRESLGPNAPRITAHMAQSLNLGAPASSWHSMRDGIADYGHWLALITGTLGKMGQDICLMAQQGIGEIGMASGGASSAMPHKQNPVLAELLVTLARFNAGQQGLLLSTMLHEQERSGASWALEWMTLPQMTVTTGAALRSAVELIGKIERIGAIKD
ncbi:MAG: lyase family protein, partial [Mangrovicoccus sp.]